MYCIQPFLTSEPPSQNLNQEKTEASKVQWSASLNQLETKDSTHQDWNQFDLAEDEQDDWEVTSNIRPVGIELAPNLRQVIEVKYQFDKYLPKAHGWKASAPAALQWLNYIAVFHDIASLHAGSHFLP